MTESICCCAPDWLHVAIDTRGTMQLNYRGLKEFPYDKLCEAHKELAKQFHMKRNLLKSLPDDLWKHYPAITELYLLSNMIERLPDSIGHLKSLVSLNLTQNFLSVLPSSITSLSRLRYLIVRHNLIAELPSNLGCLDQLEVLDVSHNKLEILPSSVGKCHKLDQLLLSYNNMIFIPRDICLLSNLQELSVSGNKLIHLPIDLGLSPRLTIINLENNPMLHCLPSHVLHKSAYYFGCAQCHITDEIYARQGLHKVTLSKADTADSATLLLPYYIESNSSTVLSMLEISSRSVVMHSLQLSEAHLALDVVKRLSFPIGHCYKCSQPMFWSGIVKYFTKISLHNDEVSVTEQSDLYIVSFFCSSHCTLQS